MLKNSGRSRGLALLLLAIPLLAALAITALSRTESSRAWMRSVTGEENWWEQFKGTGALVQLSFIGPRVELEPDRPVAHKSGSPMGTNTFFQLEPDPEVVRRSFEMLSNADIRFARQHFPWEDIEIHASGDFEDRRNEPYRSAWDKYDRIVDLSQQYEVELMARLDDPPSWAYENADLEGAQKGPPSDPEDYGRFVAAVVGRYCGQIRYYQIWNEPNIYPEWGERDVDPAAYAALLEVAARSAREACEDVVLVSAALAPTTEAGGRNMHDLRYIEGLYEAGWKDHFDILAVQGFGIGTGPQDRRLSENRTNMSRPMLVRDIMVRNEDADKTVWISEFGWDNPPPEMDAPWGRADEERRAEYTIEAFDRIEAEWPWVGTAFVWFFRRPDMEWHSRPEGYFRMVEPDWTQLPIYDALVERGKGARILYRGRHRADSSAISYSGPWQAEPLDGPVQQMIGSETSELQFLFDGTGFELHFLPAPAEESASDDPGASDDPSASDDPGASDDQDGDADSPTLNDSDSSAPELFVAIDGAFETLVPEPEGDRFVLRNEGLDAGEHFLVLRVDAGEAWLDELRVLAPDPPSPLRRLWPVLGGLAVLGLIWLALLWKFLRSGSRRPPVITESRSESGSDA